MNISLSIENFKSFMAERGYFPPHIGTDNEFVRFSRNGEKDKSAWRVRFKDPPNRVIRRSLHTAKRRKKPEEYGERQCLQALIAER